MRELYDGSLMVLAASEDKTHRGAGIASPSMPWGWGHGSVETDLPSGPYHLVWSRDLYQVATALLAAGDAAAASRRARLPLLPPAEARRLVPAELRGRRQGALENTQLDEVALPIVLAWQLGRTDAPHVGARPPRRRLRRAPRPADEAGALGEPERLVARRRSPPRSRAWCAPPTSRAATATSRAAARYEAVADAWAANVERWTATRPARGRRGRTTCASRRTAIPTGRRPTASGTAGPDEADQRRDRRPELPRARAARA